VHVLVQLHAVKQIDRLFVLGYTSCKAVDVVALFHHPTAPHLAVFILPSPALVPTLPSFPLKHAIIFDIPRS
jgi:hypothetical protein